VEGLSNVRAGSGAAGAGSGSTKIPLILSNRVGKLHAFAQSSG